MKKVKTKPKKLHSVGNTATLEENVEKPDHTFLHVEIFLTREKASKAILQRR